jgi:hypothetical protein
MKHLHDTGASALVCAPGGGPLGLDPNDGRPQLACSCLNLRSEARLQQTAASRSARIPAGPGVEAAVMRPASHVWDSS